MSWDVFRGQSCQKHLVLQAYCECLRSILGVLNTRARSEERLRSTLHSWPVDGRQVRGRVVTKLVYELFLALQFPSSNETATFLSSLSPPVRLLTQKHCAVTGLYVRVNHRFFCWLGVASGAWSRALFGVSTQFH